MMWFPFTYDMYDKPSCALLAQIELRSEVHGVKGDWFLGAMEVVDLDTGAWREIGPGSALYDACWKQLRTPDMTGRIDLDFNAHCDMHGEDGLLDAAELKWRHTCEDVA